MPDGDRPELFFERELSRARSLSQQFASKLPERRHQSYPMWHRSWMMEGTVRRITDCRQEDREGVPRRICGTATDEVAAVAASASQGGLRRLLIWCQAHIHRGCARTRCFSLLMRSYPANSHGDMLILNADHRCNRHSRDYRRI